jgi:UDP-N-acetylglucosamine 2-epimerase
MKILSIVGARPNFMKVAPLHRAFQQYPQVESKILHTGQHYDEKMSDIFFSQLGLPESHYHLGVGSGSHTWQTAHVMLKFEEVLKAEKPDLVLVVGDVNATVACSIVAVKMGIPVAHVEAGLRSGDRTMPEEVNRIITDSIARYLFVTEQSGMVNLAKEGVPDERVFFVGNVMIDSLVHYREKAAGVALEAIVGSASGVDGFPPGMEKKYGVDRFPTGMENKYDVDGFPRRIGAGSTGMENERDADRFPPGMENKYGVDRFPTGMENKYDADGFPRRIGAGSAGMEKERDADVPKAFGTTGMTNKGYILMTMHRPANVDNKEGLEAILQIIEDALQHQPVVFPIHPRTENSFKQHGLWDKLILLCNSPKKKASSSNSQFSILNSQLFILPPQGYLEFLKLMENAALIITDSGGIQEETTYLQVPCMTFRDSTERPVTVELGTNFLMKDLNPITVKAQMVAILEGKVKKGVIPPLWDGCAAERIAEILFNH